MTPEEIRTLYEYDAWANARTLNACAALTQEQLTRNLGNELRLGSRHARAHPRRADGFGSNG